MNVSNWVLRAALVEWRDSLDAYLKIDDTNTQAEIDQLYKRMWTAENNLLKLAREITHGTKPTESQILAP